MSTPSSKKLTDVLAESNRINILETNHAYGFLFTVEGWMTTADADKYLYQVIGDGHTDGKPIKIKQIAALFDAVKFIHSMGKQMPTVEQLNRQFLTQLDKAGFTNPGDLIQTLAELSSSLYLDAIS